MAQAGGRIRIDTRSTDGAIITVAFKEIDALRFALIREQSGHATPDDRRLIKKAKQSGRNLDEIRALTVEGIQAYLERPPVSVNGKSGEIQKSNGKAPKAAYRDGNGNKDNGSITRADNQVVTEGSKSSDQNQDVAPVADNESWIVQEGMEQIALAARELGALPISEESSVDSIIPPVRVEGQVEGLVSLSDAEITVFLATNDGIEELREQVVPPQEGSGFSLQYKRPKFGPPPVLREFHWSPNGARKDILQPDPGAELKPFVIPVADFVRADTGVIVHLGESTGFLQGGQEREFIARVFVVGPERPSGRKEQ